MLLSRQDYDWLWDHINEQPHMSISFGMEQNYYFEGAVQAKERPRKGKSGKFYTPRKTLEFEAKVAEWGLAQMGDVPAFSFPLAVDISVVEVAPSPEQAQFSRLKLIYPTKGDIDNIGKSILDALNGVMWRDDKQIVDLRVRRRWGRTPAFRLKLSRAGLATHEYQTFLNVGAINGYRTD